MPTDSDDGARPLTQDAALDVRSQGSPKSPTADDERQFAFELVQWLTGKWISRAIHVAAQLSIADLLSEQPLGVEALARKTNTHAPTLFRLMRALSSIGLFRECEPQRFELTARGAMLKQDRMRAACLMAHSDWHDAAWSQLLHSLRTGGSGFEAAHGMPLFDWLAQNPPESEIFSATMSAGKTYRDHGIADSYDFSGFASIVDVGGGHGSLALSILQRHPRLSAVVADLPNVVSGAKAAIDAAGLKGRCEAVGCDFFVSVPPGADAYLLAHVVHDWDDAACARIFASCRSAMRAESKLLLVETIMPEDNEANRLKWLDLEMLVLTHGGRERTAKEYRKLLAQAGFALNNIIPTGGSRCLLEAVVS